MTLTFSRRITDVDSAFLYADLQEDIFMEQPEGFRRWSPTGPRLVYNLRKAVYGLKQTPFDWNSLLHCFSIGYGLFQLKCDNACYALLTPDVAAYVAVYVDDVFIFCSNPEWTVNFKAALFCC